MAIRVRIQKHGSNGKGKQPNGSASFMPKNKYEERKKRGPNKTTKIIKEAILEAAARVGKDGKGKDELVGYLVTLAEVHPKSFAQLLARVIPLQVAATIEHQMVSAEMRTVEQVKEDLERRGLAGLLTPTRVVNPPPLPKVIEHEPQGRRRGED